jgi:chromate reductase, NAD(P)H dehydrogenase (quinone)
MKILALCGSLRAASINAMLLRVVARLAPAGIQVTIFDGLRDLPLFNPDLEAENPVSVRALYEAVAGSDALIIASPEYAHGVSGTIKNALDWLVGFEPFAGKTVAVLNASPRSHHADDSLRETLRTMAAQIVESASISIPLLGSGLDECAWVAHPSMAEAVRSSLRAIQESIESRRAAAAPEFLLDTAPGDTPHPEV